MSSASRPRRWRREDALFLLQHMVVDGGQWYSPPCPTSETVAGAVAAAMALWGHVQPAPVAVGELPDKPRISYGGDWHPADWVLTQVAASGGYTWDLVPAPGAQGHWRAQDATARQWLVVFTPAPQGEEP